MSDVRLGVIVPTAERGAVPSCANCGSVLGSHTPSGWPERVDGGPEARSGHHQNIPLDPPSKGDLAEENDQ